jgi:hypothetical protein
MYNIDMESDQTPTQGNASSKKGLIIGLVAGGVALLVVLFVFYILFMANIVNKATEQAKQEASKPLTIGSKPYVYPCSVATEADYARIFGLDDDKVGTMSETSAMAPGETKGGDLTKIAPSDSSEPRYSTSCVYTLAKKGATQVNRIEVELTQLATDKEAEKSYNSTRKGTTGDYTDDGVDNGRRPVAIVPGFSATDSFYIAPTKSGDLATAGFFSGSHFVKVTYSLNASDTPDGVTPLIGAYAQAIKEKLANAAETGKATDLTGHATMSGAPIVDLCRRVNKQKLQDTLGDIGLRPDELTTSNTYGSLQGSRASQDGTLTDCSLEFNTKSDRQAQAKVKDPKEMTSSERWPHTVALGVNTFASEAEAAAYYERVLQQFSRNVKGTNARIDELKDVGDKAVRTHKETSNQTSYSGESQEEVFIEDIYAVLKGKDVLSINMQQTAVSRSYQTAPLDVKNDALNHTYKLLSDTLRANRK